MTAPDRAERNRQIATLRGCSPIEFEGRLYCPNSCGQHQAIVRSFTAFVPGAVRDEKTGRTPEMAGLADFHTHEWTARLLEELAWKGTIEVMKLGEKWYVDMRGGWVKGERETEPTLADAACAAYIASKEGQ